LEGQKKKLLTLEYAMKTIKFKLTPETFESIVKEIYCRFKQDILRSSFCPSSGEIFIKFASGYCFKAKFGSKIAMNLNAICTY